MGDLPGKASCIVKMLLEMCISCSYDCTIVQTGESVVIRILHVHVTGLDLIWIENVGKEGAAQGLYKAFRAFGSSFWKALLSIVMRQGPHQ